MNSDAARRDDLGRRAVVVLLALLLLTGTSAAEASERRIRFARGRTSARVEARLRGPRDEAVFVLRARRGQRMRVRVVRSGGPVRTTVVSPAGEEEGQPGTGVVYEGELQETGDYRVRVRQSPSAEAWRGRFLLEVSIR